MQEQKSPAPASGPAETRPWVPFAIGAVLGAWQIGGMSIVGAAQNGYTMGIAGCWYSIAGGVYFLLVGALSKVLRENMVSEALPDFLARRYSTPLARLQSYIWVIFGCIYIPIQLKTIASIIQIVIPSFNSAAAMVCGVTIAAVYTGFAGMKGSSAIGRIVCISTYVLLIIFVVKNLAGFGGYGGLISQLPKDYDKLIGTGYADTADICLGRRRRLKFGRYAVGASAGTCGQGCKGQP